MSVSSSIRSLKAAQWVLLAAGVVLAALVLNACAPAATPTSPPPTEAMTEAPATEVPEATEAMEEKPSVTVSDQEVVNGTVTVAEVYSSGPGWVVIHADDGGKPGPVLGYTALTDGENTNVAVTIEASKATETLYAMLHTDAGAVGTYEFPGADVPVQVDGAMVSPAFKVTGGSAAAGAIVQLGNNDQLGSFLVDAKGISLYLFTKDTANTTTCYDKCAVNWPPLLVADQNASLTAGEGITGTLATIVRTDGTFQVTYNGIPLYYYIKDKAAGDVLGQGVGDVWYIVPPDLKPSDSGVIAPAGSAPATTTTTAANPTNNNDNNKDMGGGGSDY